MATIKEIALEYAGMGWKIFPLHTPDGNGKCSCGKADCKSIGKHPRTPNGHLEATIDPIVINEYWTQWPDANIGINCEKSGIIVVDIDRHQGKTDGIGSFKKMLEAEGKELPPTIRAITGGGGVHLLFKKPDVKLKGKLCEGIDVKDKGYIVAPPSKHYSGMSYRWQKDFAPSDVEIAELPEWLLNRIKVQPKQQAETISPEGVENIVSVEYSANMSGKLIVKRCSFLEHCVKDAISLSEPDWYYGTVGVLCRTVEAPEIVHKYSSSYHNYNYEETQSKIEQSLNAVTGATTCEAIKNECGDKYCQSCIYNGYIKSPIRLGVKPVDLYDSNVQEFPFDSLPEVFAEYVKQASKASKSPPDYIAVALLAAVSRLIGNSRVLRITSTWTVPAAIYCGLIGRPGMKKTVGLSFVQYHLDRLDTKLHSNYLQEYEVYKSQKAEYSRYLKGGSEDAIEEPVEPTRELIYTNQTTVEALGEIMSHNQQGIMILSDELSEWLRGMNQYRSGKGGDWSYFLTAWNTGQRIITRKSQKTITIPRLFHTIVGGIQPDVLYELRKSSNINDGFIDRFIFTYPDGKCEGGISDIELDSNLNESIYECFEQLFENRYTDTPDEICLSPEARLLLDDWSIKLYKMGSNNGLPANFDGYLIKQEGYTARLALILHCAKVVVDKISESCVSGKTMEQAIKLSEYFISHAKKVFGVINLTLWDKSLITVNKWIIGRDTSNNPVKPRDIQQAKLKDCGNKAEDARNLLIALSDFNYGIWIESKDSFIPFADLAGKYSTNSSKKK